MPTPTSSWPNTPNPHFISEEPYVDEAIIVEFEGGIEQRRSRWHRPKKEFVLTYKTLISSNVSVQTIANHATIRDYLVARRFSNESFYFVHPYFPNSVYVVRFVGDGINQVRVARTPTDGGTDAWEMEVRLREVF